MLIPTSSAPDARTIDGACELCAPVQLRLSFRQRFRVRTRFRLRRDPWAVREAPFGLWRVRVWRCHRRERREGLTG